MDNGFVDIDTLIESAIYGLNEDVSDEIALLYKHLGIMRKVANKYHLDEDEFGNPMDDIVHETKQLIRAIKNGEDKNRLMDFRGLSRRVDKLSSTIDKHHNVDEEHKRYFKQACKAMMSFYNKYIP